MSKSPSRRWVIAGSLLVVVLILIYNHLRSADFAAQRAAPISAEASLVPDVAVVYRSPARYQASVSGFGAANSRFSLTLSSEVAGRVTHLSEHFATGNAVTAGQLLADLEDASYQAAVASAEQTLASAEVDYLEEQREGAQALAEWRSSGLDGDPDSELVLRKQQLAAAAAAVRQARTALASARHDLQQTQIRAPFDAIITSRAIAPGSYLQGGGEVAELLGSDRVEVSVALSARDWASLPDEQQLTDGSWTATLLNAEDNQQWQGVVVRTEHHLDDTTRQRALVVALDQPLSQNPALLPGTFVQVSIPGRELDGLWKLPSSALSQRGYLWYVTADKTLASVAAEPVFSDAQAIYIEAPEALANAPQAILTHPLSSYLDGMQVNPVEDTSDE